MSRATDETRVIELRQRLAALEARRDSAAKTVAETEQDMALLRGKIGRESGEGPLACATCGDGDNIVEWYRVAERQGIRDIAWAPDGTLAFEYDGDTSSGETGAPESYACRNCGAEADTLEELVGLEASAPPPVEILAAQSGERRMSNVTETFEHAGLTVKIGWEEDGQFADPRDCDNLGTMVCWHPSYILGDEQVSESRGAVHRDRNGSASTMFQTETGRTDFRSMETIERYLRLARKAVVVMPLYLLDHSGISMSVGSNTVGRGDTAIPGGGRDSWGNTRGWDTTMCGFIYTTAERIEELCGGPRGDDEFYCPAEWAGTAREWIAEQLREEIRYYDAWLQGSVFWYAVENADGDVLESCGGFLIAGADDEKHLRMEARAAAEAAASELVAKRMREAEAWARAHGMMRA